MRALIIDRDKSFSQGLAFFLKNKGLTVDSVVSGEEGTELARLYDYDIILAELSLSDMTGTDFLRKFRTSGIQTPITIISTINSVAKKIECYNLGADDYFVKPGDRNELFARLMAVIRRSRGYSDSTLKIGKMSVNLEARVVQVAGKPLPLTAKEYALLELLCLRRGMTVSKEQFLNHLYAGIDEPEIKIIDVFLHRIRRKIEKLSDGQQYIQTVWGRGYILKDDTAK